MGAEYTSHMTEVESRLDRLEAKLQRQEQMFDGHEQRLRQIDNTRTFANTASQLLPPDRNTNYRSPDLRSAGVQELLPEEASTDGMAITYTDEEDSGYFGRSHLLYYP